MRLVALVAAHITCYRTGGLRHLVTRKCRCEYVFSVDPDVPDRPGSLLAADIARVSSGLGCTTPKPLSVKRGISAR